METLHVANLAMSSPHLVPVPVVYKPLTSIIIRTSTGSAISPNSTSGIVEFCNNNLWGLIAEPGWSDNNAGVVCKQLGLERGEGCSWPSLPHAVSPLFLSPCAYNKEIV